MFEHGSFDRYLINGRFVCISLHCVHSMTIAHKFTNIIKKVFKLYCNLQQLFVFEKVAMPCVVFLSLNPNDKRGYAFQSFNINY